MDTDTEGKENQGVLVGGEVMLIVLISILALCTAYVCRVHNRLKREFEDEEWMDIDNNN